MANDKTGFKSGRKPLGPSDYSYKGVGPGKPGPGATQPPEQKAQVKNSGKSDAGDRRGVMGIDQRKGGGKKG